MVSFQASYLSHIGHLFTGDLHNSSLKPEALTGQHLSSMRGMKIERQEEGELAKGSLEDRRAIRYPAPIDMGVYEALHLYFQIKIFSNWTKCFNIRLFL